MRNRRNFFFLLLCVIFIQNVVSNNISNTSMQCYRANFAKTIAQECVLKGDLHSVLGSIFDNRLLMLHPRQAVTSSREDFKAKTEQIDNIYKFEYFESKPSRGMICGQARSQKFAMGGYFGGQGAKRARGWESGGKAPSRRRHGVWGRSPQRSKILHFFAKIT